MFRELPEHQVRRETLVTPGPLLKEVSDRVVVRRTETTYTDEQCTVGQDKKLSF